MKLIIGGVSSGKLQRVYSLGYVDSDIFDCEKSTVLQAINCKVLYKLNHLIDKLMQKNIPPKEFILNLLEHSNVEVIVCDEVGCGVVPTERYERDFREAVGRICCELASCSKVVERVYCGIATVIKSDEN